MLPVHCSYVVCHMHNHVYLPYDRSCLRMTMKITNGLDKKSVLFYCIQSCHISGEQQKPVAEQAAPADQSDNNEAGITDTDPPTLFTPCPWLQLFQFLLSSTNHPYQRFCYLLNIVHCCLLSAFYYCFVSPSISSTISCFMYVNWKMHFTMYWYSVTSAEQAYAT